MFSFGRQLGRSRVNKSSLSSLIKATNLKVFQRQPSLLSIQINPFFEIIEKPQRLYSEWVSV